MATWLFRGNPRDWNLQAISMPNVVNYKLTVVEDARLAQVWEARRLRDL